MVKNNDADAITPTRPAKKTAKKAAKKPATQRAQGAKTTEKRALTHEERVAQTVKAGTAKAQRRVAVKPSPSRKTASTVHHAALPMVWRIECGKHVQTTGLWVDEHVWTGNMLGECFKLDRDTGALIESWLLPGECVAVVSDDAWKYAGCSDGCIYDLTGSVARVAYQLGGARHDWLEVYQGALCVSDHAGTVTVIDVDGSIRWHKSDKKAREGWVLRTAEDGLYHGSMVGLRKYDWRGKRLWQSTIGDVRYGVIDGDEIIVTAGYFTSDRRTALARVDRATGEVRWRRIAQIEHRDFYSNGAEACAVGRDPSGARRYFAAVGSFIFCYDEDGVLLWTAPTGCDALCNMMLQGDQLFFSSASGVIGRADVSDAAFDRRAAKKWPTPKRRTQPRLETRSSELERTSEVGNGVIVECVKEGAKLRVRVVSPGYRSEWFCQFPRDIREEGARYVVQEVREATQGGFYRVLGDIKRLV
jgi:outer membrane protein assembly factor BamB